MSSTADPILPPKGRVLVTGAAGHVGANLVRHLLRDGHEIRVMLKHHANDKGVEGLEVERFVGDVRDLVACERAVRGCTRVFHVAAKVSTATPRASEVREIYSINVLGTQNMVRASVREGIERFCLTGSFSAVGIHPDDPSRPVHEGMPFYPFVDWLPYARTKTLAEHETLKGVADGLDAVIAISTGVIGPNDFLPSRTGQVLIDLAKGELRGYIPGGSEFVTTDDIARGHLLAMARGKKGRRYLISSRFMTMDDLLDEFSAVTGRPKPRLRLPVPVMSVASRAWSQTVGRFKPNAVQRLTPGAIHILAMHRHADLSLARTELGYEPTTDVRETIREWYDFFVREGMIPHG